MGCRAGGDGLHCSSCLSSPFAPCEIRRPRRGEREAKTTLISYFQRFSPPFFLFLCVCVEQGGSLSWVFLHGGAHVIMLKSSSSILCLLANNRRGLVKSSFQNSWRLSEKEEGVRTPLFPPSGTKVTVWCLCQQFSRVRR